MSDLLERALHLYNAIKILLTFASGREWFIFPAICTAPTVAINLNTLPDRIYVIREGTYLLLPLPSVNLFLHLHNHTMPRRTSRLAGDIALR